METTVDFESMYLLLDSRPGNGIFFFFFCYPCIVYENMGSRPGGGKYILVIIFTLLQCKFNIIKIIKCLYSDFPSFFTFYDAQAPARLQRFDFSSDLH